MLSCHNALSFLYPLFCLHLLRPHLPAQPVPVQNWGLGTLGFNNVAQLAAIKGHLRLHIVERVVRRMQCVSKGRHSPVAMQNAPRLDTCVALARLQDQKQRIEAGNNLRETVPLDQRLIEVLPVIQVVDLIWVALSCVVRRPLLYIHIICIRHQERERICLR